MFQVPFLYIFGCDGYDKLFLLVDAVGTKKVRMALQMRDLRNKKTNPEIERKHRRPILIILPFLSLSAVAACSLRNRLAIVSRDFIGHNGGIELGVKIAGVK